MLTLILLLFGITLAVLLWIGTVWFQGYIYTEAVAQAHWRGAAAALAITLFVGLWCLLNYRDPGKYPGFMFESGEDRRFDKLWAVRDGKETLYIMRKTPRGAPDYLEKESGRPWQEHPDAIVVEESPGEKVRFEAERNKDGKFKIATGRSLRYVDDRGRAMTESPLGVLDIPRRGRFLLNLLLNLLHLVVWFLVLWLLLRFQWSHALGLAVVFWLLMTFTLLHMVLSKAQELGQQRPVTSPGAQNGGASGFTCAQARAPIRRLHLARPS